MHRKPSSPTRRNGLAVFGSLDAGAGAAAVSARAGAGAGGGAAARAGAGAGRSSMLFGASATTGFGGGGADPVTVVLEAISVRGTSTIFSAETTIPLRRS